MVGGHGGGTGGGGGGGGGGGVLVRAEQPMLSEITVRLRGMGTGISEASKRVPIFSFATLLSPTQGGKQVSSHFRQGNWVQARDAQIRFPAV